MSHAGAAWGRDNLVCLWANQPAPIIILGFVLCIWSLSVKGGGLGMGGRGLVKGLLRASQDLANHPLILQKPL